MPRRRRRSEGAGHLLTKSWLFAEAAHHDAAEGTVMPKLKSRRKGSVYKVAGCSNWMVAWWGLDGKKHVKSSGTPLKGAAQDMLDDILSDQRQGENVTVARTKLTFEDAAAALVTKATLESLKSLDETERRIRLHLEPFFGKERLMVSIDTGMVERYAVKRQADTIRVKAAHRVKLADGRKQLVPEQRRPVSNAEINRELTVLGRMFSVAAKDRGFRHRPTITKLKESKPRQGFFTREEIEQVCAHLPPELAAVVMFGFITAWRSNEVVGLTWDRVDFTGRGRVWLDGDMTKNGEPRTFKMTTELRQVLEARWAEHEKLKKAGRIVAHVFHREKLMPQPDGGEWKLVPGQPIVSFIKAWRAACTAAGFPGRIFHDLRRSAVRNFVRAGIGEDVAMKLSGHKTRSMLTRYNIIAESDYDDAADKLDAAAHPAKGTEKKAARVHAFSRRA